MNLIISSPYCMLTEDEYIKFINVSINEIKPHLFERPLSIHGTNHARRVMILSFVLSGMNKLNKEDSAILKFCSAYHDIGREDDFICLVHGVASVEKLKRLGISELSVEDEKIAHYIIENHCIDDLLGIERVKDYGIGVENYERAIRLYKMFKDCDSLDRVRIADLDPNYLRTNSAKIIHNTFPYRLIQDVPEFQ